MVLNNSMHLEYDICKKLKKAGFPQNKWAGITVFDGVGNTQEHGAYCPTLEQLIEACQTTIEGKYKRDFKLVLAGQTSYWSMVTTNENKNLIPVKTGSTPSEAVANLYLSLHKKDI